MYNLEMKLLRTKPRFKQSEVAAGSYITTTE